jgi:hypothetical protein
MAERTALEAIVGSLKLSPRILYPGLGVAVFLKWRYDLNPFEGLSGVGIPSLAFSLLAGTLVYYTYRSLVHPAIWFVQDHMPIGILTRRVHMSVLDEIAETLKSTPRSPTLQRHQEFLKKGMVKLRDQLQDSRRFSQACLYSFQRQLSDQERAETYAFNSGSHLLYVTATLAAFFFLHDVIAAGTDCVPRVQLAAVVDPLRYDSMLRPISQAGGQLVCPTPWDLVAWFVVSIVGLAGALSYDRNADYREAVQAYLKRSTYRGILENLVEALGRENERRPSVAEFVCRDVSWMSGIGVGLLAAAAWWLRGKFGIPDLLLRMLVVLCLLSFVVRAVVWWRDCERAVTDSTRR